MPQDTFRPAGLAAVALAALSAGAVAVAADPPGGRAEGRGVMPAEAPAVATAAGNNAFAFDLYARLRSAPGNLFFSPYSIATALAMTSAGARGETDREIAAVLHAADAPRARHDGFHALIDAVNGRGASAPRPDTLVSANALWVQQGDRLLPDFLDTATRAYDASAFPVDFASDPSAARGRINAWVEEQTREKVRDLVGPQDVTPDTALVLTNAIYYKGAWAHPFAAGATVKDGTFTTADGRKVPAPLMAQTGSFGYHDGGTFQALELPYDGAARSMLVLLPKAADGLPALEASLSAKALDDVAGRLARRRVDLRLPKFRLSEGFQLADVLHDLGMTRSFDPSRADFSGMTGRRDRWISRVIHKAFVEVDEVGTEAAAATAVVMTRGAIAATAPPAVFHADHPFLFLILDRATGSVLFLGRLNEPKG